MRAIIVDDEQLARQYLKMLIEQIGGIEVVGEAGDATECLGLVATEKPDVVFLDVRLPGMGGVELAQIIVKTEPCPKIVFVTGYDDYAVRAFEVAATDYITKPFSEERLQRTINRLTDMHGSSESVGHSIEHISGLSTALSDSKLTIKQDIGWKIVAIKDIIYAKTEEKKVRIQTVGEALITGYTIAQLEQRLEQCGFFRANEGCIVNLEYVREIVPRDTRYYDLTLNDKKGTMVPLSRSKAQRLREILRLH